jgi:putative phosphonate metabolism protein
MERGSRVALYYAPSPDDPLAQAAATWLGRDPESGAPVPQPALAGPDGATIATITEAPRLYGFHATLKPPMRLRDDVRWFEVVAAARGLASRLAPFDLPPLVVADIHGFLALRETVPCPALQALADAGVEELDLFRASPPDHELERRRQAGLSHKQEAMLRRWGYPYVFSEWFFHMTLSRRLAPAARAVWQGHVEAHVASAIAVPRRVTDICLFTQAAPHLPFVIAERLALGG